VKVELVELTEDGTKHILDWEGIGDLTISEAFNGFEVCATDGSFGICLRDGGLEVRLPSGEWVALRSSAKCDEPMVMLSGAK